MTVAYMKFCGRYVVSFAPWLEFDDGGFLDLPSESLWIVPGTLNPND